jgi:hypothetical protein
MCTEVYNIFGDTECRHKVYQNTFRCHVARRCHPDDDQLLKEPVFLPAKCATGFIRLQDAQSNEANTRKVSRL